MHHRRLAPLAAACLVVGALTSQTAQSQTPEPSAPIAETVGGGDPPGYREAVEQGLSEYGAGNFAEARALFLRAHAIAPNARTLRSLGIVEYELRNYAEAIARLEQALAATAKPLDTNVRTQVEKLLSQTKAFVGRYSLQLKPDPITSRILVDGSLVASDTKALLTLNVGEHTLVVQADGYHDEQRSLSVKGGEQLTLAIELRSQQVAPQLATSNAEPIRDDGSVWSSPWLWSGVGAVVIGGVAVGILLAAGSSSDGKPEEGVGGTVRTLTLRQ